MSAVHAGSEAASIEHTPTDSNCLCAICSAIKDLENLELMKSYKAFSVRENQMDMKSKKRFINLVGQKPMLNCFLNGKNFQVLWDTGSMVSVVDKAWVVQHFPEGKLLSIEEVLGENKLQIRAANNTDISLTGVMLLEFSLNQNLLGFTIPFLVSEQKVNEPIIGYNVIEHLVVHGDANEAIELKSSLVDVCPKTIEPMIALIQEKAKLPDFLQNIKIPSSKNIPSGSCVQIKCRIKLCVDNDQTVHFVPKFPENVDDELSFSENISTVKRGKTQYMLIDVINPTKNSIYLKKGTIAGSVHSLSAVIPMNISVDKTSKEKTDVKISEVKKNKSDDFKNCEQLLSNTDLDHLNENQKHKVKNLLNDNWEAFSTSDTDIGDIRDFQMKINLKDTEPVKEPYRRIPRHLYNEVKNILRI